MRKDKLKCCLHSRMSCNLNALMYKALFSAPVVNLCAITIIRLAVIYWVAIFEES